MIYFSAKTKGFYPTDIISKEWYQHNNSWPEDAEEVSHADYEKFIATPPNGMMLGSIQGKPAWVIKSPDKSTLVQVATMRKQQLIASVEEVILPLSRAVKLNIATDEEKAQLDALERCSVLLTRINPGDAPEIIWPEIPV